MFTWKHVETVATSASAEQIWALWQDVENWPLWDKDIQWAQLEGDFVPNTYGRMKPKKGPVVKFQLGRVEPNYYFSDSARLPLTRIVFEHEYLKPTADDPKSYIRHSVTMSGFLAPLFGRLIGKDIKAHLRDAMQTLSANALKLDENK